LKSVEQELMINKDRAEKSKNSAGKFFFLSPFSVSDFKNGSDKRKQDFILITFNGLDNTQIYYDNLFYVLNFHIICKFNKK